ncbi:MAG: bifunctional riboflavin kinase/FAD synthetase [Saprospiraceae bacterium]
MKVHRDLDSLPAFRRPVLTIGSFDGVHLGHYALLQRIAELADRADGERVVVTFDPHPRHVLMPDAKPPLKLLTTIEEKIERFAAAGVDHLVVVEFTKAFSKQTAEEYLDDFLFGRFKPHTIVIGYDHRFGVGRSGNFLTLEKRAHEMDINVVEIVARDVDELAVSSTRIRKAISAGEVKEAGTLLGTPYWLSGKVVHGQAIGRTIGFPTANLDLESPHKLLPVDGVYAVRITVIGKEPKHEAMLYIGERPSLEGKRPRTIEANILDFKGDLYGKELRVELIQRIRGDVTFESLDALKQQIQRDREETIDIFQQLNAKT